MLLTEFELKREISPKNENMSLAVFDFLLSDEYSWSPIKRCPGFSKRYNGSEWAQTVHASVIKVLHIYIYIYRIKAFGSEPKHLCKKNIHI